MRTLMEGKEERERRGKYGDRRERAGRKQGEWEEGKGKNGSDHKKQKSTKTHCTNIYLHLVGSI